MLTEQPQRQHLSVSASLHLWLFASSCFSCLLLLVRLVVTDSPHYIFLPWNLFLAFIPYGITWLMTRNVSLIEHRVKFIALLTLWLLFFPNSFYIITDLFHLSGETITPATVPKWFDLLLIFSFAWNGMVAGIVSLRRVEIILSAMLYRSYSSLLIFPVMWLSAFGIYIGRFLRYNSWDVLTNPFSLAVEIWNMLVHPVTNSFAWGMTLSYSLFMTLLYFTIRRLSEFFMVVK